MNEHFVNVKVDREERPDVDALYMDAAVALNRSGGWPLNVFLTPEGKPFWAATYLPPVRAQRAAQLPGHARDDRRPPGRSSASELEQTGASLTEHLRGHASRKPAAAPLDAATARGRRSSR